MGLKKYFDWLKVNWKVIYSNSNWQAYEDAPLHKNNLFKLMRMQFETATGTNLNIILLLLLVICISKYLSAILQ